MIYFIFILFFICSGITGFATVSSEDHGAIITDRGYYYEEPEEGVLRILTYNIRNCIYSPSGETGEEKPADG